jgi:Flp pilus assembly protein TadG
MKRRCTFGRLRDRRGQTLVEFGLVAVLTLMLLLAVVEFGRMVLAYSTVNNAARVGLRFAMVHGSDNLATSTQVQTIVNNYLTAAAIDTSTATVTLSYPAYAGTSCAANAKRPGCPVEVQVSYPYQTMLNYFPIHVNLASQAEGIITF